MLMLRLSTKDPAWSWGPMPVSLTYHSNTSLLRSKPLLLRSLAMSDGTSPIWTWNTTGWLTLETGVVRL